MDRTEVDAVIARVCDALRDVPGVVALALGGSWARGTASADSDIDVGLYYDPGNRPDFAALLAVFSELNDLGRPEGFGRYGEWGPWINGGAWLRISGAKVDILLRDTAKVEAVVRDCAAGKFEIVYQVGHPHGFSSTIYAGEVFHNLPVLDPDATLSRLKAMIDPYPKQLARAVVEQFGWESGFAVDTAVAAANRGDAGYVCGCAFRAIACLTQVLFAAEGRYLLNEKGAVAVADTFACAPEGYAARVVGIVGRLSGRPSDLQAVLAALRGLRGEVLDRAGVSRRGTVRRVPP